MATTKKAKPKARPKQAAKETIRVEGSYVADYVITFTPYGIKTGWTREKLVAALNEQSPLDEDAQQIMFSTFAGYKEQEIQDKDGEVIAKFELTYEELNDSQAE